MIDHAETFSIPSFDSAAVSYDTDFTFTQTGLLQRERVYHFLTKYLSADSSAKILEINCGTGEDALWLARKSYSVTATDASFKMIETANKKRQKNNFDNLKFEVCAFETLTSQYQKENFDLIFSNFGGLNCVDENDLKKLAKDFSTLLKPNGKFIAVVMGRNCAWEIIYFMLKLKFKSAFRRSSKKGVMANVGTSLQETFYYSPEDIKSIFNSHFAVLSANPIGFALPPSYLDGFFRNKKILLKLLQRIERMLSFSFLSNFGDHFFIVLESKKA